MIKFVDLSYKQFKTTDIARCLKARYTAAPTNHACEDSGVITGGENVEIRAVLTPEREEKRQNGRRMKDDGEPMFTLTAQDRHGIAICHSLKIKEATAKGYAEAKVGDGVNLSNPNSNTRRGRVGNGVVNTLTCDNQMGVVVNDLPLAYDEQNENLRHDGTVGTLTTDGSSPKHNNRGIVNGGLCDGNANERNTFEILCLLRKEIGEKAFAEWGIAITTSFQQAEVLQQGVHEKSIFENREKQSNIQQCSHNSEIDKQVDYERNCLPKMWLHEKFRCSSHGRRLYEQYREQFDCAMQKLSYENPSYQEFMYALWSACEGIGLLQQALSKIQEVRRCIDVQWQKGVRIRRLTPREVWRLQGFPDEYFDKARAAGISDSQLYKMAGNAVTVNVAYAIGLRLKEIEDEE